MHIENIEVVGIEHAIRAMRNPLDSWGRSDSGYVDRVNGTSFNVFEVGGKDKELSQRLTKSGSEHCKHLRFATVYMDIVAPRFFWQEFDTYKHVEKVSCSTMHTIHKRELEQEDFEEPILEGTLEELNWIVRRLQFLRGENLTEEYKIELIYLKNNLPEGFLQKRTVVTNFQQLLNIYHQRKNHRLPQWGFLCDEIKKLKYFQDLVGEL